MIIHTRRTSTFAKANDTVVGTFGPPSVQIEAGFRRGRSPFSVESLQRTGKRSGEVGMPTGNGKKTAGEHYSNRAVGLRFIRGRMVVALSDGRELSVPLENYPTLRNATRSQREDWELLGRGEGIHWAALDLDLSTDGLLQGLPERVPAPPAISRPVLKDPRGRLLRRTAARRTASSASRH
jgi:hypothetical protein